MKQCLFVFFVLYVTCCNAQKDDKVFHDAGFYNTIEWENKKKLTMIPQVWLYLKNYYLETRYNYENDKTVSLYFGKSYSNDKKINYEIIPMIGLVYGQMEGISPGFNLKIDYKRFTSSTQCQYTYDFIGKNKSFFWDWSNFYIKMNEHISLGCAIQINRSKSGDNYNHFSPSLRYEYHTFFLEVNAFNFWETYPLWSIGFEYDFK